jgi:hypothetical protein
VILLKPGHDFLGLRMQQELTAFETYNGATGNAFALHHPLDVIERKMFRFLLPDIAMLAFGLAERG